MPIDADRWKRWEEAIRAGQGASVSGEITEAAEGKLDAATRLKLAALSYRVGVPKVGVSLLSRTVRGETAKPSPKAAAVYAFCLVRIGAAEEAERLVAPLAGEVPLADFAHAAALMAQWRYREAIAPLERYVAAPGLSRYDALVGRVNLLSAYVVAGRRRPALAIVRTLLHDASVARYRLLHANALELAAQYHLAEEKWDDAERCLDQAEAILAEGRTLDRFLVDKWRAVVGFRRDGDRKALEQLRREAEARRHWETVRDCDRIRALGDQDTTVLWNVYFGTPHVAYRQLLLEDYARRVGALPVPDAWTMALGPSGRLRHEIDLVRGEAGGRELPAVLHRLLLVFARDRYAPVRIATLFGKIFPDEHFHPETSTGRVHQAVSRLRQWIAETHLPLVVDQDESSYRLSATEAVRLRVPGDPAVDATLLLEDRLRSAWGTEPFTVGEAEKRLPIARRTLQRGLDRLVTVGQLERVGQGRGTRYRFASSSSSLSSDVRKKSG